MSNGDFGRLEFLRRLGRIPPQVEMVQQPSMGPVRVPPSIVRQPATPTLSPSMQRLADLNAARYVAGVPSPYRMPSPASQPAVAGGPQLPPPPEPMARPAGLTPMDRAGLAAGIAGLQYAGPQTQPTSFAQGLGVMGRAAMEAFDVAEQREEERAAAKAEIERQRERQAIEDARYEEEKRFERERLRQEREAQRKAETAEKDKIYFDRADKLRDEFTAQSKEYDKVENAVEKVIISGSKSVDEATGADDLALLFGYMKLLDPGSVVRESEFRQAQTTSGIPDAILALRDQVLTGTKLTSLQRERFVTAARDLFNVYANSQGKLESYYTDRSNSFGVSPVDVVRTRLGVGSIANPYVASSEEDARSRPAGTYVLLDGVLYRTED